jgi:hypothetical protein
LHPHQNGTLSKSGGDRRSIPALRDKPFPCRLTPQANSSRSLCNKSKHHKAAQQIRLGQSGANVSSIGVWLNNPTEREKRLSGAKNDVTQGQ